MNSTILSTDKAKEFKTLQDAYLKAKAEHDKVVEIDRKVRNKVLAESEFISIDTGERITSHLSDYQMADDVFPAYCDQVYREGLEHGLDLRDPNTVADYRTRPALRKAEDNLLNFAIFEILPAEQRKDFMDVRDHWKYREKMLELTARLAI